MASHIPVVAAFDGYRAYGILGTVVAHLLGRSGVIAALSGTWLVHVLHGTLDQFVDILFIISGFVVFLPTVARHGDFGNVPWYAIRRAARLVPAYWLVLVILLVLTALAPIHPPFPFPPLSSIGVHTVFGQIPARLFPDWQQAVGFGQDDALWTLSLEVTFYVLLPFIAAWYFRRPLLGLFIAAAITAVWQEALIHGWTVLGYHFDIARLGRQFPAYAFAFATGMTGAWAYVRVRERYTPAQLARPVGAAQLISLISLGVFCYVRGFGAVGQGLLDRNSPIIVLGFMGSLAAFMVTTALGSTRWQWPFAHPFARWLGDISYGMFLINLVIINYAIRLFTSTTAVHGPFNVNGDGSLGTFLALTAVVLPLTVLYGYISGRYLEQPIRRWAHRFGRREQAATARPATAKVPAGS